MMTGVAALLSALVLASPSLARADAKLDLEMAKLHYALGAKAYEAKDYETALSEFKKAYEKSRRPAILFNLGRVEARLGHEEAAIDYLKQYLAAGPDAVDVPSVKAEIAARERALQEAKARSLAESEELAARRAADESAKARAESDARAQAAIEEARQAKMAARPRWPAYLTLVVGALSLAGGITCNVLALDAAQQMENGGGVTVAGYHVFDRSLQDRGQALDTAGIALDVIGGALLATSVGLFVWAFPKRAEQRAWIAPTFGGLEAGGVF